MKVCFNQSGLISISIHTIQILANYPSSHWRIRVVKWKNCNQTLMKETWWRSNRLTSQWFSAPIIDTTTKSTFTMKRCKCWGIRRGQRTYSKASLMFWITFASSILQPIPNSLCKRSTMPWSLMCSRSTMLRSPSLKFLKNWSTLLIDYLRKSSLINVHLLAFLSLMVQIRIIYMQINFLIIPCYSNI